ncbi:hypothetical protein ALC62_11747, partial [Cyphomyrmex costatus]
TVGNYLIELCQDGTRDPIGCTLIEYRSGVVLPLCRTFADTSFAKLVRELRARRFKKEGRVEEERADRKEGAAEEEVINGNEDCLAKCEWPASEDIDGRMDGWTGGGSVWTDGHCIGHPHSLSLLQFPILRSSTYVPADTTCCSCFYHYCYYNFGGWTSDEPMRRLLGEIREKRRRRRSKHTRSRISRKRESKRKKDGEQQEADAKGGPSREDKMVKKRKKKWLRYHRFEVIRRRMNIRTELTTYPPIAPIYSPSKSPPSTSGSFHKTRPAYH